MSVVLCASVESERMFSEGLPSMFIQIEIKAPLIIYIHLLVLIALRYHSKTLYLLNCVFPTVVTMAGVSVLTLLASAGRVIGTVKRQQQEQHNEPH